MIVVDHVLNCLQLSFTYLPNEQQPTSYKRQRLEREESVASEGSEKTRTLGTVHKVSADAS